jgi:hypothetical protein
MSNRIKILDYKGHKILLLDASNLKVEEIIALFPEYQQTGATNRIRLYLLDVTNTRSNDDIRKASSASIDYIKSKVGEIHVSLVGITGLQKIIASAIKRDSYFASSLEDGKDWLVKQAAGA